MNRAKVVTGAAITILAAAAWLLAAFNFGPMMGMPSLPIDLWALGVFVAAWTLGMVAMMFPTVVPTLLAFFRLGRRASPEVVQGGGPSVEKAAIFTGTYLGFWVLTGVVLYVAIAAALAVISPQRALAIGSTFGVGVALVLVALYQFSPVKGECVSRCHPTTFLFRFYRGGLAGSAVMGANYAKYCVGCCWVMMAFLMVSASMGAVWMAVFAAIIFAERNLSLRAWMPKLFGVGFLIAGAALVLLP